MKKIANKRIKKRTLIHKGTRLTWWHEVAGLCLIIIAIQPIMLGINGLKNNIPVAGLMLEGRNVSRDSPAVSRQAVDTLVTSRQDARLSVYAGTYKSSVSLRQLGVMIDSTQLYNTLVSVGRSGNAARKLTEQNRALFNSFNFSLNNPSFNTDLAQKYLAALDQKISTAPINAFFELSPDQQVTVRPDTAGTTIDTQRALAALASARPEKNPRLDLPLRHSPAPVTLPELQAVLPEVQNIARKPFVITAGASSMTLSRAQLLALLIPRITPVSQPGDNAVQVSFDEIKLKTTVDQLLKQVEVAPQPTVMNGGTLVRQGRPGLKAANDHALTDVLAALIQRQLGLGDMQSVNIPLIQIEPPVIQQAGSGTDPSTRTGTGLVRLTFDDGPGAYTEQVLDILARYNVHAAFYLIGRNVPGHASTVHRMHNEGHVIGNHSYTHSDLTVLSRAGIQQELSLTQSVIEQACGVRPTAFRPPYGAQNQTVREVAADMGMSVDLWSVDARDWSLPGSNVIKQNVLGADGPGAVVLLHVLYQQTVDALPSIIEGIRAQGYTLE